MSKAIISSALRVSDYLDKQAIREKEKRKEKILSILPSFIEQQVSGITDKQTLFKTIPRLSADLYAYGPDIGNAANQILGNIAQTKFREIGEIEEKKSAQDIANIISQSVGDKPIEFNGQITNMAGILNQFNEQGIPLTTSSKMLEGIAQRGAFQKKGIVQETKEGTFYREYDFNNLGTERLRNSFKVDRKTSTLDDLSKEGNENLPYTPEVIAWQNKIIEDERNAQQQLSKSLTIQKFAQDYGFAKQEEAFRNQVKKKVFYDMKTGETVKADLDESGSPYFYKEQNEGTTFPGFGTSPDIKTNMGGKKNRIVVNNVSDFQEVGQFPQNTDLKATDLATQKSISNKFLIDAAQKIAQASGYDTDKALSNLYDATGRYFDPERVRTVFDEYIREELDPALQVKYDAGELTQNEIQQLVSSDTIDEKYAEPLIYWQAYRKSQGLYEQKTDVYNQQSQSRLGQQSTTTTKQKLPGWK